MGNVLFSILTDVKARTNVETQLEQKLEAGIPWFNKEEN